MMTEPDVTLTDYALAIECGVFTYLIYRQGNPLRPLRVWFSIFFGSLGLAVLIGGSVHGFFRESDGDGYAILWRATLLAIGMAALAAWVIGARIQFSETVVQWILVLAAAEFLSYSIVVLFDTQVFWIAIALSNSVSSAWVGSQLEEAGYLLSYKSKYLLNRNWIQICLMGECSQEKVAPLLDLLQEFCLATH